MKLLLNLVKEIIEYYSKMNRQQQKDKHTSASVGFEHQDIETLVIRGKSEYAKKKRQMEGVINTPAPTHKMSDSAIKMSKLDRDTESTKVKTVSAELSKLISQARTAKKMSQKQLASQINITQAELQKYENGTAIPNNSYIQKLQKALGVKLTGLNKKKK